MIDLKNLTIQKAHEHLLKGDFTARELAQAYLDVIKEKNKEINAYLEVFDDVLEQAEKAQKKISKDNPLAGIPIAVKDNILIKGKRAGAASKILEGYVAPYDSTAIARLREKGVVFIGRVNMDEFAMGGSTENSAYGVTKNPHDTSRVAGGSSGGSAASVAMDGALAALGSDTGGSVRQPASYCGVVGFKPTYGTVSRHGLMAMGSSLDVIGPVSKTVTDAEILWHGMEGEDPYDSTSVNTKFVSKKKKLKIGVPRKFLEKGVHASVLSVFEDSIKKLKALGHEIVDVDLPTIEYGLPVYYVIMPAEVSTNLARFDGVKYGLHAEGKDLLHDYLKTRSLGFGPEARRRILLGAYVLSSGYYDAYYNKAAAVREMLKRDIQKTFESVDLILTPTAPSPAFKIGEKVSDPVSMYLEDIFTVTANLIGAPAISIPAGFVDEGGKKLPVGIQFMATYMGDDTVLQASKDFLNER